MKLALVGGECQKTGVTLLQHNLTNYGHLYTIFFDICKMLIWGEQTLYVANVAKTEISINTDVATLKLTGKM